MFSPETADRQMSQLVLKFDPFQETESAFWEVRYSKNQNMIPAATWSYTHFAGQNLPNLVTK